MNPRPPAILVLHGITMSGAAILNHMAPLAERLKDAGFDLVAPDAPRVMLQAAVEGVVRWAEGAYAALGQDAHADFAEGTFWRGDKRDWFAAETDPHTGEKHYAALQESLAAIERAAAGHRVAGLLGFSQGCAMAAMCAALAARGELTLGGAPTFGIFIGGFKPVFQRPEMNPWPVAGVRGLFLRGARDAVFPSPETIRGLAAAFESPEVHDSIEGLGHRVPASPEWTSRIVEFARANMAPPAAG